MNLAFDVAQLILALFVVVLILMQPKGTGMGRSFGSTSYHSRRGLETLVFKSTIVFSCLFAIISIINQLFI